MKEKLYLGVDRAKITPKVGGQLFGYRPDTISTSLHDDLNVTTFYFKYGECEALLVSVDICVIKTELCDEICARIEREHGIPAGNILLCATHTHSGPNLGGTEGWGDVDMDYYENIFLPAFLPTVGEAKAKAVPVRMGAASGKSYIGINRRELDADNKIQLGQNPWGPFNPTMTVLSFVDEAGAPVANMIHYGIHNTCAGRNFEISRDMCGVMVDELEAVSGAMTAFFNGPEGDVGPRLTNGHTTGISDVRYAERHGAVAARDAVAIFRDIKTYNEVDLAVLVSTVDVPLERRVDYETAKCEYEKYKNDTVSVRGMRAKYYKKQIELYEEGYVDKDARTMPQTIVRIGDAVFISTAFELFSEIGMRIAGESKLKYTMTLSNANGTEGYFVTEDQICRGGYEVNMFKCGYVQPYADNADWHFMTGTLKNLEKLYK